MEKTRINIAIIESSQIIFEGISNILHKSGFHLHLYKLDSLNDLELSIIKEEIKIIVLNPLLILNKIDEFVSLKLNNAEISWIALQYTFIDRELLSKFDAIIQINDNLEIVKETINKLLNTNQNNTNSETQSEKLSNREIEVLIQLVHGLSNKEIADKLNLSIHTVISHRKNISQKTGIKSQSGLTIYAISNKLISLDNLN